MTYGKQITLVSEFVCEFVTEFVTEGQTRSLRSFAPEMIIS